MAPLEPHTERLVGLFFGSVLYERRTGILLTTFCPSLASLLLKQDKRFELRPRRDIKIPILLATITMFLVSTSAAGLSIQLVIKGFVEYTGPGGPLQYFNDVSGWENWIIALSDAIQMLVGDALLIYRCYVLHDRNWKKIVVPLVSYLMILGSILRSCRAMVSTFITSVSTTFLIIRRLHSAKPEVGAVPTHFLTRVAAIFFETGLIYTLALVAFLGVYLSRDNFKWAMSLCVSRPAIVLLAPSMLNVRPKDDPHHPHHMEYIADPSARG
ncbi:unnamed protein product [Mycena citricolor]|uniref:Uncharacterized protein n=1 Tax=Mycena citricolor TaxID=2018698 RepID=A0AAD2H2R5_9AGAR|nr:unnamed protein product [Mycena citricolor]